MRDEREDRVLFRPRAYENFPLFSLLSDSKNQPVIVKFLLSNGRPFQISPKLVILANLGFLCKTICKM